MKNERPAWDPPALPAEMLFSKLPPEMQKYLKNSKGLLGFATLYPSVFFKADSLEIDGKRLLMLKKLSKNYIPGRYLLILQVICHFDLKICFQTPKSVDLTEFEN